MLCQMCRQGRMIALVSDGQLQDTNLKEMANLLSNPKSPNTNYTPLTTEDIVRLRLKTKPISSANYELLFQYLYRHTGPDWRRYDNIPHPPNAAVLPGMIATLSHFKHRDNTYSTAKAHVGNSAIQFYDYDPMQKTVYTGVIEEIWQIPLGNKLRIFILVTVDQPLPATELERLPFHQYPRFYVRVVESSPSQNYVILEPPHIISHTVVYCRPSGTFGINRPTKTVCLSLNRGRY
jgi:hypothetical protein